MLPSACGGLAKGERGRCPNEGSQFLDMASRRPFLMGISGTAQASKICRDLPQPLGAPTSPLPPSRPAIGSAGFLLVRASGLNARGGLD